MDFRTHDGTLTGPSGTQIANAGGFVARACVILLLSSP